MGEWSCTVCGRVGNNSVQCAGCSGWVHKRCIDVKGSLARVENIFVCKVCERADDGEDNVVHENMDLGNGVNLEIVGKYCYLGGYVKWRWRSGFCICSEGALRMEEV